MALIEAAERMFARTGINAVSIRQIGAAIGSSNPSVVTYYFGTKEKLIEAVYLNRVSIIDERRQALLTDREAGNTPVTVQQLLTILWQPLLEQVDVEGKHSYAAFLLSLLQQGYGEMRRSANELFPATTAIVERIRMLLPSEAADRWANRWPLVVLMVLHAIEMLDRKSSDPERNPDEHFRDVIAMASNALDAPVS